MTWPRMYNGWLIEDPASGDEWYDSIIATHMLSGVALVWAQPRPGVSIWPEMDKRVRLNHPASSSRLISGELEREAAREFILAVVESG